MIAPYIFGGSLITVTPKEFTGAIENPLKGYRPDGYGGKPYCTLYRRYIKWNDIEKYENDSVDRITAYLNRTCQYKGTNYGDLNVKIVPRVYLDWDGKLAKDGKPMQYWPADMHAFDYDSPAFKRRMVRLIEKLGEAWDNDPRVFAVQMGLIGFWGEQHNPNINREMLALLTDTYRKAFRNKLILTRNATPEFRDAGFGLYYDTFGYLGREPSAGKTEGEPPWQLTYLYPDLWKKGPIEGEVEYTWQKTRAGAKPDETFGRTPDETMVNPDFRKYMIGMIRQYHVSYLGWISDFDEKKADVLNGAGEIMKAFGYRFVIEEFSYTPSAAPGSPFDIQFTVRNDGSAPMYLDWPVAFALLDTTTREPVWQTVLTNAHVRDWLPGERWSQTSFAYDIPAKQYRVAQTVTLPASLAKGDYIVALAILDRDGGMRPSARFAIENYCTGGWHPFGITGIGAAPKSTAVDPAIFSSPAVDRTLRYMIPDRLLSVNDPPVPAVTAVEQWKLDPSAECIDPWRYWCLSKRGTNVDIRNTYDGPVEGPAGRRVIAVSGTFTGDARIYYYPFNYEKFPDGRYRMSFLAKGTPGLNVEFQVSDDWEYYDGKTAFTLESDWKRTEIEFTVRKAVKKHLRFNLVLPADGAGEFMFTDYHARKTE